MNEELLTVVIPVYNGERYVGEAIESVLQQGYPNIEIIVIDDGSTDGTRAALAQYEGVVQVFTQENAGPAAARNAGIRRARGTRIGLLDADDMWTDNHLAFMMPYLDTGQPFDMVRGHTQFIRFDTAEGRMEVTKPLFMEALVGACLYRASVFETVGLFDETMRTGEDFDWNIRLAESACREKRLAEATLFYRRHESNLTNTKEMIEKGQLHAFRNKVQRARARTQNHA